MPPLIDKTKNLDAEIERVSKYEAHRIVAHLRASGETFNDWEYVEHEISCHLADAYKHIKNWH